MAEPIDVVRQFCDGWGTPDEIAAVLDLLSDDCRYHNIPLDPVEGIEAIRAAVEGFTGGVERVEFETLHIAANGNVVLTERIDSFVFSDKRIDLPVSGTFEVDADGKINHWRDYFDLQQFMSQM